YILLHTHRLSRTKRITLAMITLAFAGAIWFSLPASADIVSGRILGADEKPILNGTFTARNSKGESTTFKTDKSGNFSVYLDPGKYTVRPMSEHSSTGVNDSFPQ